LQPSAPEALVVTDAGPLMALGRQDLIGLLAHVFGKVLVPNVVLQECLRHPQMDDAQRIQAAVDAGTLVVMDMASAPIPGLDPGECAAIGCALHLHAALLVDDLAARRQASAMGLQVIGTLGVLVLAKRRGLIPLVAPVVRNMRSGGHYISEAALRAVLEAAGEA
jgi:predicted nucleic acid-binding protein